MKYFIAYYMHLYYHVDEMKITYIELGGFKNISNVAIELANLTALVGLNGFGKSNVLEGIRFGIQFIGESIAEKSSSMGLSTAIPLTKVHAGQNFHFLLKGIYSDDTTIQEVCYRYEFCWEIGSCPQAQIVMEEMKIREVSKGKKFSRLIYRQGQNAVYKASPTGRCSSPIKIGSKELVLNKLSAFDNLFFFPCLDELNTIQVYIDHHLDVVSPYLPDPIIRKDLQELDSEGINNILRAIFFLKKDYPQKYGLLLQAYRQLFPEIEKITITGVVQNVVQT
jgi:predicted ATPase